MNKAKLQRWGMNFPLSKIQLFFKRKFKRTQLLKDIKQKYYKHETDGN
jgi:hypothetical protein